MNNTWTKYNYKDAPEINTYKTAIGTNLSTIPEYIPPKKTNKKVHETHLALIKTDGGIKTVVRGELDAPLLKGGPEEPRMVEFIKLNGEVIVIPEDDVFDLEELRKIEREKEIFRHRKETYVKWCSKNEYVKVLHADGKGNNIDAKLYLYDNQFSLVYDFEPDTEYIIDDDSLLMELHPYEAPMTARLSYDYLPVSDIEANKQKDNIQLNNIVRQHQIANLKRKISLVDNYSEIVRDYALIDKKTDNRDDNLINKIHTTLLRYENTDLFSFQDGKNSYSVNDLLGQIEHKGNKKDILSKYSTPDLIQLVTRLNWLLKFDNKIQKKLNFSILNKIPPKYAKKVHAFIYDAVKTRSKVIWEGYGNDLIDDLIQLNTYEYMPLITKVKKYAYSRKIKHSYAGVESALDARHEHVNLERPYRDFGRDDYIAREKDILKNISDSNKDYKNLTVKIQNIENSNIPAEKKILNKLKSVCTYFIDANIFVFGKNKKGLFDFYKDIDKQPLSTREERGRVDSLTKKLMWIVKINDQIKKEFNFSLLNNTVPQEYNNVITTFMNDHLGYEVCNYNSYYDNKLLNQIRSIKDSEKSKNWLGKIRRGIGKIGSWFKKKIF